MRILAALPVLALIGACADAGIVQPEPESAQADVAFDRAMNMPGALEFFAEITFVATLDPGVSRVTPSGVVHNKGVVNEWLMVGDMNGPWYFEGGYNINSANGKGRSVGKPIWFEVESSMWDMTGTFDCNNTGKIEFYPTPDFIQYGHLSGCKGTGDFEGMNLWASFTNEADPGPPGYPSVYEFHGVIW